MESLVQIRKHFLMLFQGRDSTPQIPLNSYRGTGVRGTGVAPGKGTCPELGVGKGTGAARGVGMLPGMGKVPAGGGNVGVGDGTDGSEPGIGAGCAGGLAGAIGVIPNPFVSSRSSHGWSSNSRY